MKSLKPIELDAQFKYQCMNQECQAEHWLFLNQVRVKAFKLVCDCGTVYRIRQMVDVKPVYVKKTNNKKTATQHTKDINSQTENNSPYINKAIKILQHYGFSDAEASDLVHRVHDVTACDDSSILVKDALKIFGGL